MLGIAGRRTPETQNANASADNALVDAAAMNVSSDQASPAPTPPENWTYSTQTDKVRGSQTYYARTVSTNRIHQDPPYDGGTSMSLTVRKHPEWGTDVVLTITEGQMMCPSYEGCSGMVRFDDGKPQRVSFAGPEDNSSDTVFVIGAKAFIAKLKKARKLTIEKTLYEAGAPQFEFDVAGLKWSH